MPRQHPYTLQQLLRRIINTEESYKLNRYISELRSYYVDHMIDTNRDDEYFYDFEENMIHYCQQLSYIADEIDNTDTETFIHILRQKRTICHLIASEFNERLT